MGIARDDQLKGTAGEQLAELAGRVCYDSLGVGRSSEDFHKHILDVKHLSVYEHVVFTVQISPAPDAWLAAGEFERCALLPTLLNRPGVFVRLHPDGRSLNVTLNVRAALEWRAWETPSSPWCCNIWHGVMQALTRVCPKLAFVGSVADAAVAAGAESRQQKQSKTHDLPRIAVELVRPETIDEEWITLLLTGSRGMSHELVRHGDFTAISQRSTRYVDEADSVYVEHPLITQFKHEQKLSPDAFVGGHDHSSIEHDQAAYRGAVIDLQDWLIERGVDKHTARKQARGAARGYLGNALYTEVIFSASVRQWCGMLAGRASSRATAAADAEIREVFVKALPALKRSRYAQRFARFEIKLSPDGIGNVIEERASV
jgi:thymidylate synthase ThyX